MGRQSARMGASPEPLGRGSNDGTVRLASRDDPSTLAATMQTTPANPQPHPAGNLAREYFVVLLTALVLYVISLAPGVLWQDSGLAQVRTAMHDIVGLRGLALAHPLYYVITILFSYVPIGDIAYRVNLVSAILGALTVANVHLLARLLFRFRVAAVVTTCSLAVAHTFWQHSSMAEVYTLDTLLFSLELLCALCFLNTNRGRWMVLLFAVSGLRLSNHLFALLALPVWGSLLLWVLYERRTNWRVFVASGFAWFAGAGLYVALIVAEIVGGRAVGEVVHEALFGVRYAEHVLNTNVDLHLLKVSIIYIGLNFPTPTVFLSLIALTRIRYLPHWPLRVSIVLLLAIYLMWAVHYNVPDQYAFFMPAIVLMAVLIGFGADRLLADSHVFRRDAVLFVLGALFPVLVYPVLPTIVRASGYYMGVVRKVPYRDAHDYYLRPWRTGYTGAQQFIEEIRQLPDGSYLLTDTTIAQPVYYYQVLDEWNPRVYVWPTLRTHHDALKPTREDVAEYLDDGRLFVTSLKQGYAPDWIREEFTAERYGCLYRILPIAPRTQPTSD